MNDEMDYQLYVLAELRYKKEHPELKEDSVFPPDWYSCTNYKLKTEAIAEALMNNKKLEETEKYQQIQERVVL